VLIESFHMQTKMFYVNAPQQFRTRPGTLNAFGRVLATSVVRNLRPAVEVSPGGPEDV